MFDIDDLVAYFQQFGEVENGSIMYHHENHKSRGFGFVVFKHFSSVKKAIAQPYHVIMGRRVEVKQAIPKIQFQSSESISEFSPEFSPEFSSEFSDPSNSVPNPQFGSSVGPSYFFQSRIGYIRPKYLSIHLNTSIPFVKSTLLNLMSISIHTT